MFRFLPAAHLLGCEVLPHPASCLKEPLHKAGNTNISLVQFLGMCQNFS